MSSPQGTTVNNYHRDLLKAWTPENTDTNIPRFAYGDANVASASSRFLTDASYLNIQNITLGYTLPRHITRKFFVDKLRIYVSCDNVWYWSKRQGLDPRQFLSASDNKSVGTVNPFFYAPIRTISGGISITF
jgi:outer membrane cobalamin receptor protein